MVSSQKGCEKMARVQIDAGTLTNTGGVAAALGLTSRRVQQLIQDGTIPTVSRGTMNLSAAVEAYIRYVTDGKRPSKEEAEKAEARQQIADAKYKEARANMAEAEAEEIRGTMHRSADVRLLVNDLIFSIKSALTALPGRVAVDLSALSSAAEVQDYLRREIRGILREMAGHEYDPEAYAALVRERQKWEEKEPGDGSGPEIE